MVRSDWFILRLDIDILRCIDKMFKYMRNIQNLILDTGRISKWNVLFDSLNHVRVNNILKKSKNRPDESICLTFLYRFLRVQESLCV